jgi:UDP-GlcNAc:undecaprenyl-phosphate GlcNAc-1-phosphate transferase
MQYLLSFLLAMVVTMAWLPVLVRLPKRWLFVDEPGGRKVHALPIPRVGGLAMAFGVCVAAALTIHLQTQDRWFLVAAGVLIVFGALDDRFDLDYRVKLLGQLIAVGIVVVLGGVQIHALTFDERVSLPVWLPVPLTVVFLVGVTNAINLADGLDGLAGGTTFLCLCAVALLSSVGDPGTATALALAFAGAVLGFLRFNTYPASVFMGDAGSQFLGFTIGVLSVRATQSMTSQISAAIPVVLLAVPILDTLSVMTQRISEGRSPFSADKNHIHHKLLALGFRHHEAVMVIYTVQAALFIAAYFMRYESDALILLTVGGVFAISIIFLQSAARTGWSLRRSPSIAAAPPSAQMLRSSPFKMIPRLSYSGLAVALLVYAAVVIMEAATLGLDLRVFTIVLLIVILGTILAGRAATVGLLEKGILFVTATLLVYLETIVLPPHPVLSTIGWIAIGVAAVTAAMRVRMFNDRRFEVTPLDLIILFMALVVPSLLGNFSLPHGGAPAIAKLVILLYGIEIVVSRSEGRGIWIRIASVSILAALAVRSALPA